MYPNTSPVEENVAGNGALGPFTFRNVTADETSPPSQPPSTCSGSTHLYLPRVAGAGIFRFQDGSLLNVKLIQGSDCIDLLANEGHCTLTLQVTGGTGRFKDASGVLTYTETAVPVLSDYFNNPVLFDETGELTGTVSGVAAGGGASKPAAIGRHLLFDRPSAIVHWPDVSWRRADTGMKYSETDPRVPASLASHQGNFHWATRNHNGFRPPPAEMSRGGLCGVPRPG